MKKFSVIAMALTMVLMATACGGASSKAPATSSAPASSAAPTASSAPAAGKTTILTIGTADTGGTMYPVGCTIAKVINDNVAGVKVNAETSAGSPANTVNLQAGEIDLGMIAGDVAYQALAELVSLRAKLAPTSVRLQLAILLFPTGSFSTLQI